MNTTKDQKKSRKRISQLVDKSERINNFLRETDWTAERIHRLRMRLNLSQDEFASRIGVSRQTISRWENDRFTPHPIFTDRLDEMDLESFYTSGGLTWSEEGHFPLTKRER